MENEPIVTFYKFFQDAPDVRRADKNGVGSMPAVAFQYCEAMRQAASFGWFVYPPTDLHLLYDGKEVFQYEGEQWFPLKSVDFSEDYLTDWKTIAPAELKDHYPPYLTEFYVPGIVQIWSGYFVQSKPGWSLLVRGPSNFDARSSISLYEGIVETDEYKPAPLFINVRCVSTDREIYISRNEPLFQVQPVRRETYNQAINNFEIRNAAPQDYADFDWDGLKRTVRDVRERGQRPPGTYAVSARKRAKSDA